ncbi:MAG: insulysin [Candidatus Azotimanducaceae bacterium]|jgi:insulysin
MMKYLQGLLWLPFVFLLTACASPDGETPFERGLESSTRSILKSPNDDREYRYLKLGNGLQVVLISDAKADKSAAALSVSRGSFDDPEDRLGLAHFLEHMLFIGTEKYPEPDGYFSFVQSHGGSSNAYTSTDHTNYFFDIQPVAFREGLDRFAHFFISPLFDKAYVEREKNAVHSEYQLQIKDDGWRSFATQKAVMNPDHPVSKFNIGTLDTLAGDVHSALLAFFEAEYSANQMNLVVLSRESLDEMQPWITALFSKVENRNLKPVVINEPVFKRGQLPVTLRHDKIRDEHDVAFTFAVPAARQHYRKKPLHYLANLIGHEGKGSLHSLLNEKGWINSLAAGDSEIDANNGVMTISISLTEEGSSHIPEISGYLFEYLDLLRESDLEKWRFDEQARVSELAFRFSEKTSAINAVRGIAPELAHYEPEDLLIAPYLMELFDAPLIRQYLSYLRADNVAVTISSPDYQGSETEQWFGVSYDVSLGPILLAEVESELLALPEPNPFVPESLALVQEAIELPQSILKSAAADIYVGTDTEFGVPRAVMHVSLRNEGGFVSLEDVAASRIYALLVQDDLNALAYPALLAGVSYQIATPPRGFRVSLGGYQDKQLVLLDEVLSRLVNLEIKISRFDVLKGEMLKGLANASLGKPYLQSYQRLQDIMIDGNWTPDELIAATETLSVESLLAWRDRTLEEVSLQVLVHGNVLAERGLAVKALVEERLSLGESQVGEPVVQSVEGANSQILSIDHDDAAMVLYVQDDGSSFENRAKSALLTHLIAPGYFSTLRTDQQLGYAVFAVNTLLREHGGISFVVQSPVAGPDILRSRTLDYMESQEARFANMSEEEFGVNKGGLINKLTQRDKNLGQRAGRYWSDLDRGVLTFDSNQQLAAQVSKLTLKDMQSVLLDVNKKLRANYVMVSSDGRFSSGD